MLFFESSERCQNRGWSNSHCREELLSVETSVRAATINYGMTAAHAWCYLYAAQRLFFTSLWSSSHFSFTIRWLFVILGVSSLKRNILMKREHVAVSQQCMMGLGEKLQRHSGSLPFRWFYSQNRLTSEYPTHPSEIDMLNKLILKCKRKFI